MPIFSFCYQSQHFPLIGNNLHPIPKRAVSLFASLAVLIYLFTFPAPLMDCVNLEGKRSVYIGFQ